MKFTKIIGTLSLLCLSFLAIYAQDQDPVLFEVDGNEVRLSEFNYIYNKNNGDKADYSKESVSEYLDLYQKFKLKVQKAREMKLDTIPELITELAGYRKQLADSYLTDKEVTESLIREVFERQKQDIKVRHLVVRIRNNATAEQKLQANLKINKIYQEISSGLDFKQAAKAYSEDVNTKGNGGELNYLSAMLPDGYYEFENAMYNLNAGDYSEPILSRDGYHILQVIDKRPTRGELEVAHILVRKKKQNKIVANAQAKIDSAYQLLKEGENFTSIVSRFSDDQNTIAQGGNLGVIGISTFEKSFEDAAFGLQNDGEYSKPIETSIGYHIIKRLSKPETATYEKAKRKLQSLIKKDGRFESAKQEMLEQIKVDAELKENEEAFTAFFNSLNADFFSYKWKIDPSLDATLFTLAGKDYSIIDFANYCKGNTRVRLRYNKNTELEEAVGEMYTTYLNDQCLKYEEENLEHKYPEFKALMREYSEGILLFEATKLNVWDKASQDTVGLKKFFNNNSSDYVWKERAELETYLIKTDDENLANKIAKYIKKNNSAKVIAKYNTGDSPIILRTGTYERGDLDLAGIKFKPNAISDARYDTNTKMYTVRKIISTIPKTPKTLKDARGYIIADYQDYLDKKWVAELRNQFEVKVNKEVLNSILK